MVVNRPNVHKLYQHLPLQDPPKSTQIAIFGLKICHLATLVVVGKKFVRFFPIRSSPDEFPIAIRFFSVRVNLRRMLVLTWRKLNLDENHSRFSLQWMATV
jgi:hypothetical protein